MVLSRGFGGDARCGDITFVFDGRGGALSDGAPGEGEGEDGGGEGGAEEEKSSEVHFGLDGVVAV